MTKLLAICGKGGTGKSTIAGLIIRELLKEQKPILAVDADPNSCLGQIIGLKSLKTVGQVLEEFMGSKLKIPAGMSKQAYLELKLNEVVAEGRKIDLIVMGRPEGPGCYCSANAVLRDFLDKLRNNYFAVVVDNEAGMEHLSRRTAGKIDVLIMVSDASIAGLRTVKELLKLVRELNLEPSASYLVLNRVINIDQRVEKLIDELGIELATVVPEDKEILEYELEQRPLLELPDGSQSCKAIQRLRDLIFYSEGERVRKLSV